MKINKLTASFGKLDHETLKLHDGLNVIYAPNESGKSTWCAFIRAMLYGVDSSERSRAGYLPDKLRYAPWSGAPMEGSMELTSDRCDITISRSTRAKNAPMKEFSATYTGSNVPVEGVTASNAGEMLTGVNKEVFYRSAFIAQGTMALTGSPELEKRISAIVATGEEQCSYSEAEQKLSTWERRRRYKQFGMLPKLEESMDEAQRKMKEMNEAQKGIRALEDQLEENKARSAKLEAEVTESRKNQRKTALEKLSQGRAELKTISEAHDDALAELSLARAELRASHFGECSMEELEEQQEEDLRELEALRPRKGSWVKGFLALLFFALAAVGAWLYGRYQEIYMVALAGVFCVAAILLLMRSSAAKQASKQARNKRREILLWYKADSVAGMRQAVEAHRQLINALSDAERQELICRDEYEQARQRQEELEAAALGDLDFVSGPSRAAMLGRELAEYRQKATEITADITSLQIKIASIGDPVVLSSQLQAMEEQYEQINLEYEAIKLASETLKAADIRIQSRFSPELGRLAAHYMSLMTAGRYSDVLINRDFTTKLRTQEDIVPRESEYLSAGTLDLMYLAVRLAVCELALPQGESCPLIIDDALVNLDEARYAQALDLLREIARKRQVILFTCRK